MLSCDCIERLKRNWGPLAEAMECNVECRIYDPASTWEWFVYGMNPKDEDEIICIEKTFHLIPDKLMSLSFLLAIHNYNGDFMANDLSFRRQNAVNLYKKLREGVYAASFKNCCRT